MAAKPTKAQIDQLTAQVDQLVMVQTNVFIRELLRELGKKPGANKQEFRVSLTEAIAAGTLTKARLDEWLRAIEGWGNQHVYAFEVHPDVVADRAWADEAKVQKVATAAFAKSWRAPISHEFPAEPELTRTDYDPARGQFLVEWQEKTDAWVRDKDMDHWPQLTAPQLVHPDAAAAPEHDPMSSALLIDGDTYSFRAYRKEPGRSLMRFALLLKPSIGKRPIAALFLRVPVRSPEHAAARDVAWRDLDKLVFGSQSLAAAKNSPWSVSTLIKNLDSEIVGNKRQDFSAKTTKFAEGQASVEFVAPPNMVMPQNIMNVRLAITPKVMKSPAFVGSSGDFHMRKDPQRPTSREAHVQLFQPDNRIRILTELDAADVWAILETFDAIR